MGNLLTPKPAFTEKDVGKTLKIGYYTINPDNCSYWLDVGDEKRKVSWLFDSKVPGKRVDGNEYTGCNKVGGKIVSVEGKVNGIIRLENGDEFSNPKLEDGPP